VESLDLPADVRVVRDPPSTSIGVSTNPGQTALTRTSASAYSSTAAFVRPRTPCFAATYAGAPAKPTRPRIDATLTITPPPESVIAASSAFVDRQTSERFVSITSPHVPSVCSAVGVSRPPTPALLTPTSRPPNSAVARPIPDAAPVTSATRPSKSYVVIDGVTDARRGQPTAEGPRPPVGAAGRTRRDRAPA
jgi:hypothetical protein